MNIFRSKIALGIILIIVVGGGVYLNKNKKSSDSDIQYQTETVGKKTIISSVMGSGQVSASNMQEIKPKVSGDVIVVNFKSGQEVKKREVIIQLDKSEAEKAVRDASLNLESANLSLEKLKQPTDELTMFQATSAIDKAREDIKQFNEDLEKAYEDGFTAIADTFLDAPSIMTSLENILLGNSLKMGSQNLSTYINGIKAQDKTTKGYQLNVFYDNYEAKVKESYTKALGKYEENFEDYKNISRYSDKELIGKEIDQTYETIKIITESLKVTKNMIDEYENIFSKSNMSVSSTVTSHQNTLSSNVTTANKHLAALLSIKHTIESSKDSLVNAGRVIAEKNKSLDKLEAGADELDISSQELSVKQKRTALLDAKEKLDDYDIKAPFDGIIAKIDTEEGSYISSGTVVATFIKKNKIAEISLNEVDTAKVKVDQKVTITFDAIEDLSITGKVSEVDILGTVTQGVVTYNIKISFDTQDERIKPGMTVSTAIISDIAQDVIVVPNSAITYENNQEFVEVMEGKDPKKQRVEIGISNDTHTEIKSGLKEGDLIVTQKTTSSSQSRPQEATRSLFPTGGRSFGGGRR
ncbi:efflux RND transporter periplasmic adaptor subunit [Candidatus Gracilibacteria bacterium]|nr:efflux RND transporter periplasmic adaptor subunit [Candidatus Gracilibacteria bacterium]